MRKKYIQDYLKAAVEESALGMWDEILRLITSGQFFGIPTLAVMAVPFVVGLVAGFLMKKVLKIALIIGILALVAFYLGLFSLSLDKMKETVNIYGPQVVHYATLLIGVLPLGIGFFVGLIVGFLFG